MIARIGFALVAWILLASCSSVGSPFIAPPPTPIAQSPASGMISTPIRLEDIPIASIPDPIAPPSPPEIGPAPGDPTDEIVLESSGQSLPGVHRIRAKRGGLATLWLDGAPRGALEHELRCGVLAEDFHLSPIRWATLEQKSAGVELVVANGWIDRATCGVTITERHAAIVAPLVSGLLYAFRTESSLMLLFPGTSAFVASEPTEATSIDPGAIGEIALPLTAFSLSFVAAVEPHAWMTALRPRDGGAIVSTLALVEVGIEVTRSTHDEHPLGIAYVTAPRPRAPSLNDIIDFREDEVTLD